MKIPNASMSCEKVNYAFLFHAKLWQFFSCITTSSLFHSFINLRLQKRSSGWFILMPIIMNMLIIGNEIAKVIVHFSIPEIASLHPPNTLLLSSSYLMLAGMVRSLGVIITRLSVSWFGEYLY